MSTRKILFLPRTGLAQDIPSQRARTTLERMGEVVWNEAALHPGLYERCNDQVDLSTLRGPGFGYRLAEINRTLPAPAAAFGDV